MLALRLPRLGAALLVVVGLIVVLTTTGHDAVTTDRPAPMVGGTSVQSAPLTTASAIQDAVDRARPGDDLVVAGGSYTLSLDIGRVSGTATNPIRLRPAPGATVTFKAASNRSYVLYLHHASHWQIGSGDGQLVLDGGGTVHNVIGLGLYSGSVASHSNPDAGPASHITLRNVTAQRSGQSLVRIAHSSSEIDLVDSRLTDSGLRTADYGEGLYIGSATGVDTPRAIRLRNVRIDGTRAEAVDVKPGATDISLDGVQISDVELSSASTETKCAIAHRSGGTLSVSSSVISGVRISGGTAARNVPCGIYTTGPTSVVGTVIRDTEREALWANSTTPGIGIQVDGSLFERNGGDPDGIRASGTSVAWTVIRSRFGSTSSSVTGPGVHSNNGSAPGTPSPGAAPPAPGTAPGIAAGAAAVGGTGAAGSDGLWVTYANGAVHGVGRATVHGAAANLRLNAPVVAMARTATGGGYWLLGLDGGIFSYGDAAFHGSTGGMRLNQPVVSLAAHPTSGYWFVAADGGVFSFGAPFHGSAGNLRLNQPVVGMATTTTGNGYWLVARDGGVFSYGDAVFSGSTGHLRLNQPVVAMAADPDGRGYWFVAADGGVFAFDAAFHGSGVGRLVPGDRVVDLIPHAGGGYWLVTARGGVIGFGAAGGVGRASA